LFSYVDTEIRKKLERDNQLVNLDRKATPVDMNEQGGACVSLLGPIPIPRLIDGVEVDFLWYPFVRHVELHSVLDAANAVSGGGEEAFRSLLQENMCVSSLLATPDFHKIERPLVRIHSCCMTGDVFGSLRCECGPQLEEAFRMVAAQGGAVVYMSGHEGRGIGLWAKAVTYLLQDAGQDTYQANTSLGLPEDSRDFTDAAVVLRYLLHGKPIRLLSNNPLKREHLEIGGQKVAESIPHIIGVNDHNLRYLRSKRKKGHTLPEM